MKIIPIPPIPQGSLVKFTNETAVWVTKMVGWMTKGDLAIILEIDTKGQNWYKIISSKRTGWVTGDHMEMV